MLFLSYFSKQILGCFTYCRSHFYIWKAMSGKVKQIYFRLFEDLILTGCEWVVMELERPAVQLQ